jgi:hypothetical protein
MYIIDYKSYMFSKYIEWFISSSLNKFILIYRRKVSIYYLKLPVNAKVFYKKDENQEKSFLYNLNNISIDL